MATFSASIFRPFTGQFVLKQWLLISVVTSILAFSVGLQALTIGDEAPVFKAESTQGTIEVPKDMPGKYVLLFSHPLDFTPVCTTELAELRKLKPLFDQLNTVILGLSVDTIDRHQQWEKDIAKVAGQDVDELGYAIIADDDLSVAQKYGMLSNEEVPGANRTPLDNKTARTVFLIGPDQKIKMTLTYPMTTGRNFDEIVRVLHSVILNDQHKVSTPANWKRGEEVIIPPSLAIEEAQKQFGEVRITELPSRDHGHPDYLRYVKEPEIRVATPGDQEEEKEEL